MAVFVVAMDSCLLNVSLSMLMNNCKNTVSVGAFEDDVLAETLTFPNRMPSFFGMNSVVSFADQVPGRSMAC
jgi:hypothetical protein